MKNYRIPANQQVIYAGIIQGLQEIAKIRVENVAHFYLFLLL